jgi:hypothetical protein
VTEGLQSLLASGRGGSPGVWIDSLDYGRRLFLGGDDPWVDPARFVNGLTQAQHLLKSDIIDVRVGDYVASWLTREGADLKPARRPTSDLKQILGDDRMRAGLLSAVGTLGDLAKSCAGVALTLPSPRNWIGRCVERNGGDLNDYLDEDTIEMAAMYLADFVRIFAESGIVAILLEEDADPGSDAVGLYQPILNVASGYQWSVALLIAGELETDPNSGAVDACIAEPKAFASLVADGSARGVAVPASYWTDKFSKMKFPDGCELAYVRIPEGANPEQVLERLQALREAD